MPEKVSREFIHKLPKVELHVHLEGSVRPETLRELARAKGRGEREIEEWIAKRNASKFRYRDFAEFINAFVGVSTLLETPADYALATRRLVEWLHEQNVCYAEVTLSAGVILWKKLSLEEVFEAIAEAASEASRAAAQSGQQAIRVTWILDAIRQFGAEPAMELLERVARLQHLGVIAFGIGGDEARGPAELFPDVYRRARDLGLHVTAHAGETCGPESVRQAVELLGAERIGHGLTAAQDAGVMKLLRERRIPLEVCLTSNVATGVLEDVKQHPLQEFIENEVIVTLNSDDPAMFGTSLEDELNVAAENFPLESTQLVRLMENAVRAAFLSEEAKQPLLAELAAAE